MKSVPLYSKEADALMQAELVRLCGLSFEKAAALPAASAGHASDAAHSLAVTVFSQRLGDGRLIIAQLATRGGLGLASFHREEGLVFALGEPTRPATKAELRASEGSQDSRGDAA